MTTTNTKQQPKQKPKNNNEKKIPNKKTKSKQHNPPPPQTHKHFVRGMVSKIKVNHQIYLHVITTTAVTLVSFLSEIPYAKTYILEICY